MRRNLDAVPAIFCRVHHILSSCARKPARVVPPRAPDARPADGRRALGAARSLRANRAARRAGAGRSGRSPRLRSRTGRRLPPRARLPDEAHGPRRGGGRGALRRPGRRARARTRARRCAPEAPRVAPGRGAGAREPRRAAFPRRHARLVPRGGPSALPARHRRRSLARPARRHALSRGLDHRDAAHRPARPRAQGGGLVPARAAPRRGARVPRVEDRLRPRARGAVHAAGRLRPRRGVDRPLGGVRADAALARGHGARSAQGDPLSCASRASSRTGTPPTVVARFGGFEQAFHGLLAYGPYAEVLAPLELRERIARAAAETAALYARGAPPTAAAASLGGGGST